MASWRDTATQQAQDDLDGLVNASLPFAQQMLDKHGEFFPYGVALDETGEVRMLAGDPGLGEQPPSTEVLETLLAGLRQQRDGLRAAALVADVRMQQSDAIRVELEHRERHAIAILLPYKTKRLRRGVEYGDLSAGPSTTKIWDS